MKGVRSKTLSEFFDELRFAPKETKKRQLASAEKLLKIVDTKRDYPFEFICYRITDYRPKEETGDTFVSGEHLEQGLRLFVSRLSSQLTLKASEQPQRVYTAEQIARRFKVSTKTVQRWRKRGLVGRMFVFKDGKRRIGFLEGTIDDFVKANTTTVARAHKFRQLGNAEKEHVIELAEKLAREHLGSRHAVIKEVAYQTGRAIETIRYTLADYEKRSGQRIFRKPSGALSPKDLVKICRLHEQGIGVTDLARRYHRSRSTIHRILNQRKARQLLARKIEYIDSEEFADSNAMERILPKGEQEKSEVRRSARALLKRDEEQELFRRYNFLKYLACQEREKVNAASPSGMRLQRIEELLEHGETVKRQIIEANMRLVVSIANKHVAAGANLHDLVSEGNFSLMRAVEKFDYTRGYRFSTYASWAIAKDFARKIPAEASRPDRTTGTDLSNIQRDLRLPDAADMAAIERAHHSLEQVIENNLDERERFIIRNHFGLDGNRVTHKGMTLKDIGEKLELSKERVRQLELVALQKLRHSLSTEEFDLLTG